MSERVRVGVYPNTPEVYNNCYRPMELGRSMGCPYPGWCIEILRTITATMNVSLDMIYSTSQNGTVDWGILNDDKMWSGALGTIERGEVDTVCLLYQPTQLRSEYFDFSTSVVTSRPVFVVREPTEHWIDYIGKVFKTFQTQLWFMFILIIAVQMLVMIVCYWLEAEVMSINVFKPFGTCWQIFRFFIVQPHGKYRRRTYGGNILMSGCAIATLLFTSLYQGPQRRDWSTLFNVIFSGLLLTRMLDPISPVPFTSSEQMLRSVAQKEYSLITNYKNNWFFDELTHSNWSYFARLREAVKTNPVKYVATVQDALDEVVNGDYIYPTQEDSNAMFEASKRCSLVFVDNAIPALFVSFAFRKGSPLVKKWNEAMIKTQTFQIKTFDKYMRDKQYMANEDRCFDDVTPAKKMGNPLSLFDLLGAFLLILTGYFLGCTTFVVESCAKYKASRTTS